MSTSPVGSPRHSMELERAPQGQWALARGLYGRYKQLYRRISPHFDTVHALALTIIPFTLAATFIALHQYNLNGFEIIALGQIIGWQVYFLQGLPGGHPTAIIRRIVPLLYFPIALVAWQFYSRHPNSPLTKDVLQLILGLLFMCRTHQGKEALAEVKKTVMRETIVQRNFTVVRPIFFPSTPHWRSHLICEAFELLLGIGLLVPGFLASTPEPTEAWVMQTMGWLFLGDALGASAALAFHTLKERYEARVFRRMSAEDKLPLFPKILEVIKTVVDVGGRPLGATCFGMALHEYPLPLMIVTGAAEGYQRFSIQQKTERQPLQEARQPDELDRLMRLVSIAVHAFFALCIPIYIIFDATTTPEHESHLSLGMIVGAFYVSLIVSHVVKSRWHANQQNRFLSTLYYILRENPAWLAYFAATFSHLVKHTHFEAWKQLANASILSLIGVELGFLDDGRKAELSPIAMVFGYGLAVQLFHSNEH